jgi:hypothetical protein
MPSNDQGGSKPEITSPLASQALFSILWGFRLHIMLFQLPLYNKVVHNKHRVEVRLFLTIHCNKYRHKSHNNYESILVLNAKQFYYTVVKIMNSVSGIFLA